MVSFDRTIPPGGQGKITLKFDTTGYKGRVSKSAAVMTNDPQNKQFHLGLSAEIISIFSVKPWNRVYISTSQGRPARQTLTLINTLEQPVEITALKSSLNQTVTSRLVTVEKGRKYLDNILSSARRMQALISDLSLLSRIGRIVPDFEDLSTLDTVKEIVSEIEGRLDKKGILIRISEELPVIRFDRDRFRQIMQNLIINAVKYTGGRDSPLIEIGHRDTGKYHRFHVRDNGIGIDPEEQSKVFEKFHRLKDVEDEEGTGLGLYIVDRIVRDAGGEVGVESEKGKGSTFYFTLPKAPEEAP